MAIPIKLEVFEGPLDLLLHLIDKNKIDIYDIPIVMITEQYLAYIKQMEREDMNVVSEFLVMAATLLDIKCKMLLPKEVTEEGEEQDPREELVRKLLEYKMYKYMSYELKDKLLEASHALFRTKNLPEEVKKYKQPVDYDELLGDLDLGKLQDIFQSIVKKQLDKVDTIRSNYGDIQKEEIDMDQKVSHIQSYITKHKKLSFKQLLEKQNSKMEIVITFLVLLEMMKVGRVQIEQEATFSDILITALEDADENTNEEVKIDG
ncbi:MAG: segregation/condensation protein A [Lachnospiraceae bacterium]